MLCRRRPIDLATTLSPDRIAPENAVLYSELVDAKIGSWTVLDILRRAAATTRSEECSTTTGCGSARSTAHWKIGFSPCDNWCRPVLTWHHALEQPWDFDKAPLAYGDFYAHLTRSRRGWWDNLSSRYAVTATRGSSTTASSERAGWRSVDSCESACRAWAAATTSGLPMGPLEPGWWP